MVLSSVAYIKKQVIANNTMGSMFYIADDADFSLL